MFSKLFLTNRILLVGAVLGTLFSCARNPVRDEEQEKSIQTVAAEMRNRSVSLKDNGVAPTCNPGTVNHFITLQYARQLVNNYRVASAIPGRICQLYDQGGWVLAETFPANVVRAILNQPGICGFRVYNGLDVDRRQHIVMVGVDVYGFDVLSRNAGTLSKNGNPISKTGSTTAGPDNPTPDDPDPNELIVEMGNPCPQSCGGVFGSGG